MCVCVCVAMLDSTDLPAYSCLCVSSLLWLLNGFCGAGIY